MVRCLAAAATLAATFALPLRAQAEVVTQRNPTPEGVSVFLQFGGLLPVGRFGDVADSGFEPAIGGYDRLNDFFAPAFQLEWAFLEPNRSRTGETGSIDDVSVLVGARFFLPRIAIVSPWLTALGGVAHYNSYRPLNLEPLFAAGSHERTDPLLSLGGGLDLDVTPNFSFGFTVEPRFSFSTGKSGEKQLTAISLAGTLSLHY